MLVHPFEAVLLTQSEGYIHGHDYTGRSLAISTTVILFAAALPTNNTTTLDASTGLSVVHVRGERFIAGASITTHLGVWTRAFDFLRL